MYTTLAPGAIGVQFSSLADAVAGASRHGFAGLEFSAVQLADFIDAHSVGAAQALFASHRVKPAVFGLPVNWRGSEAEFSQSLSGFERLAKAGRAVGCTRTATWIMPCSNEREIAENRCFHIERLKPVAQVLNEHGIALGLEFIGPKTLRDSQKYPFIHTMDEMLAMGTEIGSNVGLLLDSFHWFTSHATGEDLLRLRAEQIVYVHVNDAATGVEIDQQIDNVRDLPGATGVIDIKTFLRALDEIGYDGPVAVEPFKKELAGLKNDDARMTAAKQALDGVMADLI
ncbi:MAG TPA: sugar phosphate isomerase/epimerase family protein [Tepidisphaeraceae bacterium]|jgi:sugar phosphate isomerase/epimerase